jgi:hypothetical protein
MFTPKMRTGESLLDPENMMAAINEGECFLRWQDVLLISEGGCKGEVDDSKVGSA